jgi:hypothetical protein
MQVKTVCGQSLCEFVVTFDNTITKLFIIPQTNSYFACKTPRFTTYICRVLRK